MDLGSQPRIRSPTAEDINDELGRPMDDGLNRHKVKTPQLFEFPHCGQGVWVIAFRTGYSFPLSLPIYRIRGLSRARSFLPPRVYRSDQSLTPVRQRFEG
jgi:hypothetical protein